MALLGGGIPKYPRRPPCKGFIMPISEIINRLKAIQQQHGNIDVDFAFDPKECGGEIITYNIGNNYELFGDDDYQIAVIYLKRYIDDKPSKKIELVKK